MDSSCVLPPVGEGESCDSRECAEGLDCDYSLDAPVCVRVQVNGEGGTCSDGSLCALGLVCSNASGLCEAPAQAGAPCAESDRTPSFSTCALGLYCLNGACVPEPAEGEPCGEGSPNLAASVEGEGYCPFKLECLGGVCRAQTFATLPCAGDSECLSGSCVDGACAAVCF